MTFPLLAVHSNGIDGEHTFYPAGSTTTAPAAILEGLRVLVIDDEEDARELLTIALTQRGAEVRTAATVRAALISSTNGNQTSWCRTSGCQVRTVTI